jgi:hypothetical protein
MTVKQAYNAMMDGKEIIHPRWYAGFRAYMNEAHNFMMQCPSVKKLIEGDMRFKDGYELAGFEVYEPEPEPEIKQKTICFFWEGDEEPDDPSVSRYFYRDDNGRHVDWAGISWDHCRPVTAEGLEK